MRWIILSGSAILVIALVWFLIWYSRYLYHLPEDIADAIPSHVLVEDEAFTEAIEQGRKMARKLVQDWSLPSITIAVGKGESVLWAEAFGYADLEQEIPARADMPYRIHSVSKTLTAMAAARLWEMRMLDLEKPVTEYLPDFPEKKYYIHMRQLLCHQSGIRHYTSDEEIFNRTFYPDVSESLTVFAYDSLLFEPGTSYSYSSYGYNLAGAVIERIAGMPFMTYLGKSIFAPVEMRYTGIERDSFPGTGILKYYEMDSSGNLFAPPFIDLSVKYPSGGMVSTPQDLVRFGLALLNNNLVKEETFRIFSRRQQTSSGQETRHALGWEVSSPVQGWRKGIGAVCGFFGWYIPHTVGFTPMVFHRGGSSGGMSMLIIYPKQEVVFAFASNVNGDLPPVYKMPMMAAEGFFD